ncbi:MAG: LacI family DNA-binding transcriptional regulator [Phycisphaeraceae bacterium]
MVTSLRDIAEELGISESLVSKVLSGRMSTSGASQRMVKAIYAKAKELGYQRNRAATALASGRQEIIGVFIHRPGTPGSGLTASLLEGITASAVQAQQRLWLEFFRTNEQFRERQLNVHRGDVDGLIVGGIAHADLVPEMLKTQAAGVPVVTVHERQIHPALPNVGSDQTAVVRLATEHLIEQGVRQPRLVSVRNGSAIKELSAGFRSALKKHGVRYSAGLVYAADYSYQAGIAAVEHWVEQGVPLDGIVTVSDQQALGALRALLRRGLRVPQDVKLVGVDDSPMCDSSVVTLSSVSKEYERRGALAVEMLLERVAGKTVKSATIAPTLHIRESSTESSADAEPRLPPLPRAARSSHA